MLRIYKIAAILLFTSVNSNMVHAAGCDIDYKSLENAGFGNTANILKQMSPEQCADLMRSVEALKPQLLEMNQNEIRSLQAEAAKMDKLISPSINVKDIDTKKSKADLKSIQNDILNYKK